MNKLHLFFHLFVDGYARCFQSEAFTNNTMVDIFLLGHLFLYICRDGFISYICMLAYYLFFLVFELYRNGIVLYVIFQNFFRPT